jgi:hypothetical protein
MAQAVNSLCHIQNYKNRCMMSEEINDKLNPIRKDMS